MGRSNVQHSAVYPAGVATPICRRLAAKRGWETDGLKPRCATHRIVRFVRSPIDREPIYSQLLALRYMAGRLRLTGMNVYSALANSTKERATAPTTASQYRRPFSS